jgi:hypothetical protein
MLLVILHFTILTLILFVMDESKVTVDLVVAKIATIVLWLTVLVCY